MKIGSLGDHDGKCGTPFRDRFPYEARYCELGFAPLCMGNKTLRSFVSGTESPRSDFTYVGKSVEILNERDMQLIFCVHEQNPREWYSYRFRDNENLDLSSFPRVEGKVNSSVRQIFGGGNTNGTAPGGATRRKKSVGGKNTRIVGCHNVPVH